MKKVLIITYYWPPSGGAGVQRWVKLSKYLSKLDIEVHVLTVDEKSASYIQLDKSLELEINKDIKVYKTNSFEPIKIYGRLVGKENIPTAGFSNVDNSSFKQNIINAIRSNFFIPDPRRGWNKYAYKKAVEIINENNIKTIITSSPPHSTQLIGLKLKRNLKINWVADLRDPWTDIYYYSLLNHSFISKRIDRIYEKKVLINADKILTVSDGLREIFINKSNKIDSSKVFLLPNGFDPDDFNKKGVERDSNKFVICYTGTMSEQYKPKVFLEAISELVKVTNDSSIQLQIIGNVSKSIIDDIKRLGLEDNFHYIKTVPHSEIVKYQVNASLMLLIIPEVKNSKGILTGKLFEYLASGNRIISIGSPEGDAAKIITECEAGKTFDRNQIKEILEYLLESYDNFYKNINIKTNSLSVSKYNRLEQAKVLIDMGFIF